MKCKEMLAALSDFIDGDLEDRLCAEIEAHMRNCPDCEAMVDTLRKTVLLYRTYGQEEVPADVQSRLYAVLDLENAQEKHRVAGRTDNGTGGAGPVV
jgi:predicted anti-sigma-YlaC factor YlaD